MTQKEIEYLSVAPILKENGLSLVERKDNERPDFVACYNNNYHVGIEVTDVRDISKHQIEETEKAFDKLLEKYSLSRKHKGSGYYSVKVNQWLIHVGQNVNSLELQLFKELDDLIDGTIKKGVIIESFSSYHYAGFVVIRSPGHFTYIHALPINLIQDALKRKERKLLEYRSLPANKSLGIREYWLIINVPMKEGWDFSSHQNLNLSTGFDHIYLSDTFSHIRLL